MVRGDQGIVGNESQGRGAVDDDEVVVILDRLQDISKKIFATCCGSGITVKVRELKLRRNQVNVIGNMLDSECVLVNEGIPDGHIMLIRL